MRKKHPTILYKCLARFEPEIYVLLCGRTAQTLRPAVSIRHESACRPVAKRYLSVERHSGIAGNSRTKAGPGASRLAWEASRLDRERRSPRAPGAWSGEGHQSQESTKRERKRGPPNRIRPPSLEPGLGAGVSGSTKSLFSVAIFWLKPILPRAFNVKLFWRAADGNDGLCIGADVGAL